MRRAIYFVLILLPLVLAYNNCSQLIRFHGPASLPSGTEIGNGDAYGGMSPSYIYRNLVQPCSDLDAAGVPLPNGQILIRNGRALLTRLNCADIIPQPLATSEYTLTNNILSYAGLDFVSQPINSMSIKAANCPVGLNPIVGAARTNMFLRGTELDATYWDDKSAMRANFSATMAGLPLFDLVRTQDATGVNWLRMSRSVDLEPNKRYAISFLSKKSTSKFARLWIYNSMPQVMDGGGEWDLDSGAQVNFWGTGLLQTSSSATPTSGGYFITYHFQTPAQIASLDIGFSASDLTIGSSILITGLQLEAVDGFCSP